MKTKPRRTRFCCLWVTPIRFQFVQQWMQVHLPSLPHELKTASGLNNRIEKQRKPNAESCLHELCWGASCLAGTEKPRKPFFLNKNRTKITLKFQPRNGNLCNIIYPFWLTPLSRWTGMLKSFIPVVIPKGLMVWMKTGPASLFARRRLQPRHQRRSLNQNERVFFVFFIFTFTSDFCRFLFWKELANNLCYLCHLCEVLKRISRRSLNLNERVILCFFY